MNLENPACRKAAADLVHTYARFDWDGVNLAELYFECSKAPAIPRASRR